MRHNRDDLQREVREFVLDGFVPQYDQLADKFPSNPLWQQLRRLGSDLWLDSGNIEEIASLWTREFTAVTTNNTLLNREIQTGVYDRLIGEASALLDDFDLSPREKMLEIAFILNARHGLRLVEQFDAMVSVEEHTDLAHDVQGAVDYGLRYWDICPRRFIIKIPLTPAGLLATWQLVRQGVRVNHTLGFSARQAFLVAKVARPNYVNVFLGRLNSYVADSKLGDGQMVGEKAALSAQSAIESLRSDDPQLVTRQIGASCRQGSQIASLAGMDVLTIPPKVAKEFLDLEISADDLRVQSVEEMQPQFAAGIDEKSTALDTLWGIHERLYDAVEELSARDLSSFTPRDVVDYFNARGCRGLFVVWTAEEVAASADEGKIPKYARWKDDLASGRVGLDALMNLAGLNSFATDQRAMDDRVTDVLARQWASRK